MTGNIIIHNLHDYGTGESWESHKFAVIDRIWLPSGMFFPSGTATRAIYTTYWDSILCTDAGTGLMSVNVPGPYRWNNGAIPGIVFRFGMVGANTSKNVVIQVRFASKATNIEVATVAINTTFTLSAPNAASTSRQTTITFASPVAYTRFDTIFMQLGRVGANASDDAVGDMAFLGAEILYTYTGPATAGGAGPWAVTTPNKNGT